MNIIRTTFTHLVTNGHLNGDIHKVPDDVEKKGVVVFAHGYKGFKDWGAWWVMADAFAKDGWDFLKFNFSHNGHIMPNLDDCSDESAWSNNTYSKEVVDLQEILKYSRELVPDGGRLIVMGHSRGGGIASLAASTSDVDACVLLASVCDFGSRFPEGEALDKWRASDSWEILNGRTMQILVHPFAFYEDFEANSEALNIERSIRSLQIPLLAIHGDNDTAVPDTEGRNLASWASNGRFVSIPDAGHTFGISHPWIQDSLPLHAEMATDEILQFLSKL
ncbi:MAG TPA: alpha/beta fold hydrolase [Flavobacteriales bacterium]|jgi:pimeloyl-ACP methyl ester carboxylesterase|nr:alpha/beta fold hydrolase [Flavobacteriales bacterium]